MAAAHRLIWRFGSSPMGKADMPRPLSKAPQHFTYENRTTFSLKSSGGGGTGTSTSTVDSSSSNCTQTSRKLPILLFDIMDTVVTDPFYHDIPAFFGMTMKELQECKHPTAWVDFEKGLINEMELARIFFKDGRPFDLEGLKSCMSQGYSYIEGVEELLIDIKKKGYEMHTATNYPIWYEIIEEKLGLSKYVSWTFCSCIMGKRKPDPDFYMYILEHLKVDPACCIFVDDRIKNVDAAVDAGLIGIHFKNADSLREDLSRLGVIAVDTK